MIAINLSRAEHLLDALGDMSALSQHAVEPLLKPLNPALNLHALRHTFATWRLEMGDPIIRVQSLMSHADANTLLRYAHVHVDPMADLLAFLN